MIRERVAKARQSTMPLAIGIIVVLAPLLYFSVVRASLFGDVSSLGENFLPIIAITAIAILTKVISCGLGARIFGSTAKDSLKV